jgi:hypothetical protein
MINNTPTDKVLTLLVMAIEGTCVVGHIFPWGNYDSLH